MTRPRKTKPKHRRLAAQAQRPSGIGLMRPALPVTVVRRPAVVMRRCAQIAAPDALDIYRFDADFVTPANSTLTGPISVPIAPFNGYNAGYICCIASNIARHF